MAKRPAAALADKAKVYGALLAEMRAALAAMAKSAKDAADGATHEENRSEGDKDMRATEESYVARGKAMRTEELAEELVRAEQLVLRTFATDDAIAPSALVRVLVDEQPRVFFVSTQGGGRELTIDGATITVVTAASPVGRALIGKRIGDDFELAVRGAMREWVIEAVA
jgi:transcription elongation GreA/GreB family factor